MNRGCGTHFTLDELPEVWDQPAVSTFCDDHEIEMLILPRPMQGAVESVARLRTEGHTLIAITARYPRMQKLTEAWLDYYGIAVDDLHFVAGGSKVSTALQMGIDVMVEDAPKNALQIAGAGVPVLLFGAPYNLETRHPLIHRCDGWTEVLDQIERRSALSA